ncbi:protoporphyrinogen oxidase [Paenisporosarcina cavernae]|uniref:Coproporphyrinogen III oxidase n=1 Tax=Paenisporosarcina cavernae TaxID=2320858 RepID=A0A385YX82_9BACL|nr:protoporphyrinogen oxidase [Paenisporosarcina cavernae]AYC30163.1 protoporphyrinogen oxidase [Paenisporosarcina cavernae]
MSQQKKKIIIIGGGITGLSAAFYMQKEAREKGYPLEITLIESSPRLGGKIQTLRKDGFIVERGPDSFLARKVSFGQLAEDLGIEDQLVKNATGQAYVLVGEELHPIPAGSVMGIPTEISPFVTSGLFSWSGKVRAAGDFVLPKSNIQGDQSLGHFFRRRFGNEVVENLIEPLLSGIYAGDLDRLSLQATFPQFEKVEQEHRSLILGTKRTTPKSPTKAKKEGIFRTFRDGLETIVESLEQALTDVQLYKGVRAERLQQVGEQVEITLNTGSTLQADGIILTTPHGVTKSLLEEHGIMEEFEEMPSTSVATVAMAFKEDQVQISKDGTGFVVSRNSDYSITACTWTHKKWPTTTPEGHVLMRGYVGRAGDEAIVDLSDKEIEKVVLDDLRKTTKIDGDPLFTVVTRWKEAMPQYVVGHQDRVQRVKADLATKLPHVKLAGSSYEGLGLPDCVDQGKAMTRELLDELFLKEVVVAK